MSRLITRRDLLSGLAAAPALAYAGAGFAESAGLGAGGYDVVAYFSLATDADGVKGTSAHTARHDGQTFQFATAENKAIFLANPETYAPKYLSHCAWAASRGYLAPGDPEAWTVWEGRVYLNYNKEVRAQWRKDVPGNVAKGDANWPELRAKV